MAKQQVAFPKRGEIYGSDLGVVKDVKLLRDERCSYE